jgi:hypothetical protein
MYDIVDLQVEYHLNGVVLASQNVKYYILVVYFIENNNHVWTKPTNHGDTDTVFRQSW